MTDAPRELCQLDAQSLCLAIRAFRVRCAYMEIRIAALLDVTLSTFTTEWRGTPAPSYDKQGGL